MDPWRAPQRVRVGHVVDQASKFVTQTGRPPIARDCRVQYQAKPRRCHAMTVAGRRMTRAALQSDQARRRPSQKSRSDQRVAGLRLVRLYMANCCRSARFSSASVRWPPAKTVSRRRPSMNRAEHAQG